MVFATAKGDPAGASQEHGLERETWWGALQDNSRVAQAGQAVKWGGIFSPRRSSNGIVKKRSRTFVIHSSNPYVAAAAMGMAVARNESSGNYFDPISGPILGGRPDPLAQSQSSVRRTADPMLKVNFRADWATSIQRDMTAYGLRFGQSRTLEENTDRYLNARRRIPRQEARTIHESKELRIPPQYANDYSALTKLIREGGDLKPDLSRDIGKKKSADKKDPLLNRDGIQHLHFRRHGSGDVLFVKITNTDVFVIQALPHDDSQVWVDTSLLQILHDNWPETAQGRLAGIPGESLLASERLALQYRNRNYATDVRRHGLPIGGRWGYGIRAVFR